MDRQYIHDHQVVERYLKGALTADEEQAFEEAYLGDPVLLDELQAAERLRAGFQDLDGAGVLERPRPRWLQALASPQYAAAASVLLAAMLVVSGALYRENMSLREGGLAMEPAVTRLVPLVSVRGGAPNELAAPGNDEWTVLLLDPGFTEYDTYRAVLERLMDGASEEVWRRSDLTLTYEGTIAMGLPGRLLSPGEYAARLEGRMNDWPAERFDEISRTAFSVAVPN